MKKVLFILLAICHTTFSQGQITLEECYRLARENFPLVRQYGLIALSEEYNLGNASKAYLPQLSLSGRATYQTEVTSIPISLPGVEIPTLSKDQYQIVAEISQSIWDGGATRAARSAIRAQSDVDRAQYEVNMYALRERIDNLYFGILLLDEQLHLNALFLEDLEANYRRMESYLENGTASTSDLDAVRVEQLSAGQDRTRLEANRTAYLTMLSAFIGLPLDGQTRLAVPDLFGDPATGKAVNRPEMNLYDAMAEQAQVRREAIRAGNMPQLGLFVQGGYGKPGLNMLQDRFKGYALGGIRLSWNLGSYYTRRGDLRLVDVALQQTEVQREVFLFNNELQQIQYEGEYGKYRQLIRDDDEIIRMRGNIVRASLAKFENGTISATDLVRDMIAEQNARVSKAVHGIEMLQAIYGIKNLTNE